MADDGITLDIKGIPELQKKLSNSAEKISDKQKIHARIGINILRFVDKNFRQEGIEKKWDKLADSTVFARRKSSKKILQDTGRLRKSFTIKFNSIKVEVGTAVKYAPVHEFGGKGFYTIRPIRNNFLAFPHPKGNATVKLKGKAPTSGFFIGGFLGRTINHPPLKKRKMLPTKKKTEQLAGDVIDNFIVTVTKDLR